jgi:hypothetical protein
MRYSIRLSAATFVKTGLGGPSLYFTEGGRHRRRLRGSGVQYQGFHNHLAKTSKSNPDKTKKIESTTHGGRLQGAAGRRLRLEQCTK